MEGLPYSQETDLISEAFDALQRPADEIILLSDDQDHEAAIINSFAQQGKKVSVVKEERQVGGKIRYRITLE